MSAVIVLIIANAAVFAAEMLFGQNLIGGFLAMNPVMVLNGRVWTLFTYMFVHGGFGHIFFNMFALFIFGIPVERRMGTRDFTIFYLLTGVLAGVFSFVVYLLTGNYRVFLMGASGAIFAVQFAYAVFYPDSYIYIWGILPLRTPVAVLGFTAIELASVVAGYNNGVAHLTHLAGVLFAWLYFPVRYHINPWRQLFRR